MHPLQLLQPLQALRRVADAVQRTQTDPDTFAGPQLLVPDAGMSMCRCGLSGSVPPMSDGLSASAATLGEPVRSAAIIDALHLHAGYRAGDRSFWTRWPRWSRGC